MPRGKKFTAEQIIGKLREAEVELSRGKKVPEVCRKIGVTVETVPTGDYNGDGVVDAADYIIWRRYFGQLVEPYTRGDANGNDVVDLENYDVWSSNFGAAADSGGAATRVPEPASILFAVQVAALGWTHRWRHAETSLGRLNFRKPIHVCFPPPGGRPMFACRFAVAYACLHLGMVNVVFSAPFANLDFEDAVVPLIVLANGQPVLYAEITCNLSTQALESRPTFL